MTITGAVTYSHTDRQNSVIAITNAAGAVISRRSYGPYGESIPTEVADTTYHNFSYTGRRYEPDLHIYYYRARWYDPSLGTFLETDPIGSLDYVNLYSYVGLEPGNATDPSGKRGLEVGLSGDFFLGWGVTGGVSVGVSHTEKAGFEGGITVRGGAGGGYQVGGGLGAGIFNGNFSDRNGPSIFGSLSFGPGSVSGSLPIGPNADGKVKAGNPGGGATRPLIDLPRLRGAAGRLGPAFGFSSGIQTEVTVSNKDVTKGVENAKTGVENIGRQIIVRLTPCIPPPETRICP